MLSGETRNRNIGDWRRFLMGDRGFLCLIMATKIVWTLLALLVVAPISPLHDSGLYLSWTLGEFSPGPLRNAILGNIAAAMKMAVGDHPWIVHFLFSAAAGIAIWRLLRDRRYSGTRMVILVGLLLAPAYGIWGAIVGKEVLAIIFSAFFFRLLLDALASRTIRAGQIAGLAVFLAAYAILRPPYAIGMAWALVVLMVLLATQDRRRQKWRVASLLAAMGLATWGVVYFDVPRLIDSVLLPTVKRYELSPILASAHLTRRWVELEHAGDLLHNLWWGLPFSIIGPLPDEVINRPMLTPLFIGGVATLALYLACFVMAGRHCHKKTLDWQFFCWGLVPGAAMNWFIHYPFALLNPGTGIRYQVACSVQFGFAMLALSAPHAFRHSSRDNDADRPTA